MATMITMPKLGLTMTEGSVLEWKKNEGDTLKKGEILLVVATEKLTYEVEAPVDGLLLRIAVKAGETVPVGAILGAVGEKGEEIDLEIAPPKEYGPPREEPAPEKERVRPSGDLEDVEPAPTRGGTARRVAVIGGGPGGYVAAIRAAQLGGRVTLVEKENLGGTCVNVGCIPTKALLHSAEVNRTIGEAAEAGVRVGPGEVRWDVVQERKDKVVKQLSEGVKALLSANGVEVVAGEASFRDERTIVIRSGGEVGEIESDAVIIATGSEASIPPIPGAGLDGVVTSTGALSFKEIPSRLVIIGGGVIGTEFASLYADFGCGVTVIEMMPRILPGADGEVVSALRKVLESRGVTIHTGAQVRSIEAAGSSLVVSADLPGGEGRIEADKVLLAVGRKPFTEGSNLEAAGVKVEKGRVRVDRSMRTSVPHIFAVGDCCSPIMLAHVAMMEGEVAAANIFGLDEKMDYRTAPGCVYTSPELAWVGLTEEEAKKRGHKVRIGVFPMIGNARSLISGETRGMVKIVADDKYGEVLGVHIMGARATDLVSEASLAIRLEATLEELAETIHGHPTFCEATREAALAGLGRTIHGMPRV